MALAALALLVFGAIECPPAFPPFVLIVKKNKTRFGECIPVLGVKPKRS